MPGYPNQQGENQVSLYSFKTADLDKSNTISNIFTQNNITPWKRSDTNEVSTELGESMQFSEKKFSWGMLETKNSVKPDYFSAKNSTKLF